MEKFLSTKNMLLFQLRTKKDRNVVIEHNRFLFLNVTVLFGKIALKSYELIAISM